MSEERLSKVEDKQNETDRKVAVLENIASEIKEHMSNMEQKLDQQYTIFVENQGTLKAILDFKGEMKDLFKGHEVRIRSIEDFMQKTKGEKGVIEKYGSLIGTIISGVVVGVLVYFFTSHNI